MTYKPTAADFDFDDSEAYTPSAEDFEGESAQPEGNQPMELELSNAAAPKEKLGWKGLGEDAVNMLRHSLKGGIGFIKDIPNKLEKSGKYIEEHPLGSIFHNLGQLGAGTAELGKDFLNMPHDILTELGRKEIIPDWLKKYNDLPFTHIPEGTEEALGMQPDKEKGDDLIRAIPEIAALGTGVTSLAKGTKRLLTAPSKETLFKRALETRIQEAADKTGMSEKQLADFKESLRRDYSEIHKEKLDEVTPIGQEEAINVKKGKLEKLEPDTQIPEEHVGEIPEAPDTDAIINQKKSALESAKKEAEKVVGIKENPRLEAGSKVKKVIEDVKAKASDLYNAARKHYVDQKIKVDNSKEIKALGKDINELSANEGVFEGTASEREALQNKINALEGETIDASDLFDLQRTLETMAENTRSKQYASGKGTTQLERNRYGKIADNLEAHAKTLETRLESVGGKEVQSMMKEANTGWKTFKDLEKKNPVGKGALKGELPVRSMVELTKAHPGNDFLSALVESDPELKRLVLASYTGESNVNKLLNPDRLTKKYLQDLPEIDEHVHALKQALTGVKEGEIQVSKVKKEYKDLVKSMTDAAERQKTRVEAIEKSDKLKKQIKFHEDAIPKLKDKMRKVDENSAEHARLKKELADHEKNLKDKNHLLKKYSGIVLKATGASTLMHKMGL